MSAEGNNRVREYLDGLKGSRLGKQVVCTRSFAARPASFGSVALFDSRLAPILPALGIEKLYSHQAEAISAAISGDDVIVATPTASGKSLIYNLPVFSLHGADRQSRALYLFPLKALAQDQMRVIEAMNNALGEGTGPSAAIFDGDTSAHFRRRIRQSPPNILFTNPDMLHLSILPGHEQWGDFFAGLKTVIVDEVHSYRGIFGSHVAWILRRLERICRLHGAAPRFIMSSATIGNPGELARLLIDREPVVVDRSGAPAGWQEVVIIDPLDGVGGCCCRLLESALRRGLKTIVYTGSRKMTELISVWVGERLPEELRSKVRAYRAGYLADDRRKLEAGMASGELLAVVATSALELGIDIGDLDLCVMAGYPGTMMSARQRSGRVGRRLRDSAVIMVTGDDALDKYFVRNPEEYFSRPVEDAVLDPANPAIAGPHLVCAAAEHPLEIDDSIVGDVAGGIIRDLAQKGSLLESAAGGRFHSSRKRPQRLIDLRGGGAEMDIVLLPESISIGKTDLGRALKECHPGAIYLHQGQSLLVRTLDIEGREIRVERAKVSYYTRAMSEKETEIISVEKRVRPRLGQKKFPFIAGFGRLRVTDTVSGFEKKAIRGGKTISRHRLDLPPQVNETEGFWLEIPETVKERIVAAQGHFMGAIHGLEHAMIGIMPLMVLCDRNDLGGISIPFHPQIDGPAIFVYDGHGGGAGLCRRAFVRVVDLLRLTLDAVAGCRCDLGCPSCVHSPKCGSGNRPIDKKSTIDLCRMLLRPGKPAEMISPRHRVEEHERAKKKPGQGAAPRPDPARRGEDKRKIPKNFGVFDLETKRSAAEVGGWHRAERMGVSVGVVYDSRDDRFHRYREGEMDRLVAHLFSLDLVVGFNNIRFDNLVLSAYTERDLSLLPSFDILQEIRRNLGYRLSLDRMAEHTLGAKKSGDGLDALRWYKEGRFDLIEEYCEKDVRITRDLFLFGVERGYLLFANKAGEVVRCHFSFNPGRVCSGDRRGGG